jgi:hypothetical protein
MMKNGKKPKIFINDMNLQFALWDDAVALPTNAIVSNTVDKSVQLPWASLLYLFQQERKSCSNFVNIIRVGLWYHLSECCTKLIICATTNLSLNFCSRICRSLVSGGIRKHYNLLNNTFFIIPSHNALEHFVVLEALHQTSESI